jgi:hypothetical protein
MTIVECEMLDEEKGDSFYLGPIVAVSDRSLAVHHIHADAEWFENPEVISFADITQMRFDDEYSRVYSRYSQKLPPDSPIERIR